MVQTAFVVAFVATASVAQAQTTTCNTYGTQTVCTTQQPHKPFDYTAGLQRGIELQQQQQGAAIRAQIDADFARARAQQTAKRDLQAAMAEDERQRVIAHDEIVRQQEAAAFNESLAVLIREGRCEDAKNFALQRSNIAAADQAMRVCTPVVTATTGRRQGGR